MSGTGTSPILVANSLGRWYGQVVGLNELTLEIEPGVTGLVGPNGAGKSTFLKLVAGEIRASRGSLEVLGCAPFANRGYYEKIGFCPQQDAMYEDLTGRDMLVYLLRLSGFPRREARKRAEEALDRVGLTQGRERRLRTYSKGMRQRVKLAQAIAHGPQLIIADEPLTGLDPLGRREMTELFLELGREGTHVLLSSHVLHEVEKLTESIVLLHRGRLLAQGSVSDIRRLLSRHPRRVELELGEPRRMASALIGLENVASVSIDAEKGSLAVETLNVDRFFEQLTEIAARERCGLRRVESSDASLEAVFDYLVG